MSDQSTLRAMGALKGLTKFLDLTADNTVASIKPATGKLYFLQVTNPNTEDVWVQLFDDLVATIVSAGLGTAVPKLTFCIPAGGGVGHETVWNPIEMPVSPVEFETAITYAVTTTKDGNTAPTLDVVINALHAH